MNLAEVGLRRGVLQRARRFAAWHPEWWVVGLSAAAWWLMFDPPWAAGCCAVAKHSGAPNAQQWISDLSDWLVMIIAMMLPLMVIPLRAVAFGSLWRRRHWATGEFLVGYLTVWLVAGAVSLSIVTALHSAHLLGYRSVAAAAFFAAAGWQLTTLKSRFSSACHRTAPLAPDGWPAARDCILFGIRQGLDCVANCGLLMLAALISPWPRIMMVLATLILLYERYGNRPRPRATSLALGVLALGQCFA